MYPQIAAASAVTVSPTDSNTIADAVSVHVSSRSPVEMQLAPAANASVSADAGSLTCTMPFKAYKNRKSKVFIECLSEAKGQ